MQNVLQLAYIDRKQNVERAQKEIDHLEAEAQEPQQPPSSNRRNHDSSKKPATAKHTVNGTASSSAEHTHEKDADTNVATEMKKASLDDNADA
jgi:protein involved in polysaccharide export with SLBB domain